MPTIAAHQLGQRRPLFADYALPLPELLQGTPALCMADLIAAVVRAEVTAFVERQAQSRLLGVLSAEQLSAGLIRGKISSGGSELQQEVDVDAAIATALQAFADGLFLVVVDGREVPTLQASLELTTDSRVVFVRLTALVGG